jgi:sarcosine oxidase
MFRLSYPEAHYVALAREALPLWRELERASGQELLRTTGGLDLGVELPHAAALDEHGLPYELLDAAQLERRFGVRAAGGIYQSEGGVLHAERCQRAFLAAANFTVHERTRLDDLEAVDADVVVVTAGSWVNRFGFDLPVRVTRETVAYLDLGRETPTIIDWAPQVIAYALTAPGPLLKFGFHHAGHETDPELEEGPNDDLVARELRWVAELFAIGDPQPVRTESCLYTTTPDESFVLERRGRVVIGSPCSGHGFKFAPAIGERLAELALA